MLYLHMLKYQLAQLQYIFTQLQFLFTLSVINLTQ